MKRLRLIFLLVLLMATAGQSQQNYSVEVSVSSGIVFPSSPMTFADYWNVQYGGALNVGIPLSPSMTLVGSLEHYQFKMNADGIQKGFDTNYMREIWIFDHVSLNPSADPSSVTTLSANVRMTPVRLSGVISPYFIGGIGVMRFALGEIKLPTTSVLSVNGSDISMTSQQTVTGGTQTSAFFQFGMGLNAQLTQSLDLFIEARYASGLNKGLRTVYLPITGGIKMRL